MKKALLFFGLGFFAHYYWTAWRQKKSDEYRAQLVKPLEPGAKLTGNTQRTENTASPGAWEVIGSAARDWAEVLTPGGTTTWVEVVKKEKSDVSNWFDKMLPAAKAPEAAPPA
jgi:hypothetical protein